MKALGSPDATTLHRASSTVAVIPVKSFETAKGRLVGSLPPEARAALGRALAEHTVETVKAAGLDVVVVAGDEAVSSWAGAASVSSIPDPSSGLDDAAAAGVAAADGAAWLVIHADLPLLVPDELRLVLEVMAEGRVALAPSADGGTTAYGGHSREARFAYGPGSFHRHLSMCPSAAIVARTGFLNDLDSPDDLRSALAHHRGRWLRKRLALPLGDPLLVGRPPT